MCPNYFVPASKRTINVAYEISNKFMHIYGQKWITELEEVMGGDWFFDKREIQRGKANDRLTLLN